MKISSLAFVTFVNYLTAIDAFHTSIPFARAPFYASPSVESTTIISTSTSLASETISSDSTQAAPQFRKDGLSYKPISLFGKGHGTTKSDKQLLGGKGANLAIMSGMGLSVPPGFTISTECCHQYCNEWSQKLPESIWSEIQNSLLTIEESMECQYGNPQNPLLLSVRSGAAISMPGMMDTVLNLGMNDDVVKGLAEKTSNPRFAWDSYRRFLEMFGNVVLEIPRTEFEDEMDNVKYENKVDEDSDLSVEQLQEIVERFKTIYKENDLEFPQDVYEQLQLAIGAVFQGWMGHRAVKYRQVENIRDLLGTAVNVQAMVFGNMGDSSGTGVCFTRDPNTGEKELFGEFLINAQGEDVVAGIRTPKPIIEMEDEMPDVYQEFHKNTQILEKHYGDMQDIEFTIQEGKLFMLQTRSGKRGGGAAVKIAVDLVQENLITKEEAVGKVTPDHLDQLLHPTFSEISSKKYKDAVLAKGLPASPGAAVGVLAFTNEKVVENEKKGIPTILVRDETSPDDIEGMYASEGILTARGGMTSHAAVVARGWGRPCICGCNAITINEYSGEMSVIATDGSSMSFVEGTMMSLNGATGEILYGKQLVAPPSITGDLKVFMDWVDQLRTIDVLANADTPDDAKEAVKNGASGIGLCRSEHMFFQPERIRQVRQLILGTAEQEELALQQLLNYQRIDYYGIFKAMDGKPVTIRLLDPPLHEFLPDVDDDEIINSLSQQLDISPEELIEKVESSQEVNPMLGLRGCRLGITRPSIIEMQTRAILEAALNAIGDGIDAKADIMIPLVGKVEEFRHQAALIRETANKVFEEKGKTCDYQIGTMIEIPRAALISHIIAKEADFFSFGSNDLTQMTFGYSRDDVGTFLPDYLENNILLDDPFVTIDTEGVGQLIQMTVEKGRSVNPDLKIGVCGEHGGDPRSVRFFSNDANLTYVSCSPFRVPIARLAAAQAAVTKE